MRPDPELGKLRGDSIALKQSPTFSSPQTLQNAIDEAIATLQKDQSLSASVRSQAIQNLRRGVVKTRTVGAGAAKNSVLN